MGLKYPNGSGKVSFQHKRDKVQFGAGVAIFAIGCIIYYTSGFECVETVFAGFVVASVGAIVALTSNLCMKV